MKPRAFLILLIPVLLAVAGCGSKGPLYLPQSPAPAQAERP
jgi:predicted small lipoprotein YifL